MAPASRLLSSGRSLLVSYLLAAALAPPQSRVAHSSRWALVVCPAVRGVNARATWKRERRGGGSQEQRGRPRGASVRRPGKEEPSGQPVSAPSVSPVHASSTQELVAALLRHPTTCRRGPPSRFCFATWAGACVGISTDRGSHPRRRARWQRRVGLRAPPQDASHDRAGRSRGASLQRARCSRRGGTAPPRRNHSL